MRMLLNVNSVLRVILAIDFLGFTSDRSVNVAVAWDSIPSLDVERRPTLDHLSNGKLQFTGMDKVLQASNAKKTTNRAEEPAPEEPQRDKRSPDHFGTGEPRGGTKISAIFKPSDEDVVSKIRNDSTHGEEYPQNVVLLFVEAENDKNLLNNLHTVRDFPLRGVFEIGDNDNSLNSSANGQLDLTGQGRMEEDCTNSLRQKLRTLLMWSRRFKEMNTGAVSTINFSIPSVLEFNGPNVRAKEIQETQDNTKATIKKRNTNEDSAGMIKNSNDTGDDEPLSVDILKVLSKLRYAFVRALLDSFYGPAEPEDKFPARRPFPLQSSATRRIADTVHQLKAISDEKGYILVAAAPESELLSSVDLLRSQTSSLNTLLVVSGLCSSRNTSVPFFAVGPGAKIIPEAKTLTSLPDVVEKILSTGCRGSNCGNLENDLPEYQSAMKIFFPEDDEPHERINRDANVTDKLNVTSMASTNDSTSTEKGRRSR